MLRFPQTDMYEGRAALSESTSDFHVEEIARTFYTCKATTEYYV